MKGSPETYAILGIGLKEDTEEKEKLNLNWIWYLFNWVNFFIFSYKNE